MAAGRGRAGLPGGAVAAAWALAVGSDVHGCFRDRGANRGAEASGHRRVRSSSEPQWWSGRGVAVSRLSPVLEPGGGGHWGRRRKTRSITLDCGPALAWPARSVRR